MYLPTVDETSSGIYMSSEAAAGGAVCTYLTVNEMSSGIYMSSVAAAGGAVCTYLLSTRRPLVYTCPLKPRLVLAL